MTTVSVREYIGPDAMDVLARQWRELYAEDDLATPFQSPAWLTAWARQLPYTATPIVLAATSPTGRILAALALARYKADARTRFVPLSAPRAECVRLIGPHADDPAVARALAFHLLLVAETTGADVAMTDVPAASALGRSLNLFCQDSSWDCTTAAYATIPLPVRYTTLSRSAQREHARRRRTWAHLAAHRTITYTRTRHLHDLLSAFDVLSQLHQHRGHGQDQQPAHTLAADAAQWRHVLQQLGAATACIATLTLDGTAIAAQLCLTRGPRCYALTPATDPAHRHLAPGHALLRHLVADLAEEDVHTLALGPTTGQQPGQYGRVRSSTLSALSTTHAAAA
ncbi:GNAT family N-acetyltransferase [Streptomyces mirabilis]|uniref:GNAT family N-acetyltransferase n=1 Tax=Streptomyces mirabilis TaxID=68239 RepID=UPI0036AD413E